MTEASGAAPAVDVYWLPYCSTCTKAVAYLQERGVAIRSYRNLKEALLAEDEFGLTEVSTSCASCRASRSW